MSSFQRADTGSSLMRAKSRAGSKVSSVVMYMNMRVPRR